MRRDEDGVGGFFEDMPVLAFVLAGVLSVAGTTSWTIEEMSRVDTSDALDQSASQLVTAVLAVLRGLGDMPFIESVRSVDISLALDSLDDRLSCLVSVWCLHPVLEPLSLTGEPGARPEAVSSERRLMNLLCEGGAVGILEVRVVVWQDS